jgi:hypothetical protein
VTTIRVSTKGASFVQLLDHHGQLTWDAVNFAVLRLPPGFFSVSASPALSGQRAGLVDRLMDVQAMLWAPLFTATCETTVQFGDTRAVALLRVTKRASRDSRSLMIFAGSCSQITNENVFPRLHQRSPPIAASALHIRLLLGSGSTGDRLVST